jgi:hypothetical protein
MPGHRSRGYDAARARLIASRYVRDDRPRIKVRIDPLVHRSLLALAVGVALILLGIALTPA